MPAVVLPAVATFLSNMLLHGIIYSLKTGTDYDIHLKEVQENLKKELHTLESTLESISKMNPIQSQIHYPSDWLQEIEDFFYEMYDLKDGKDLANYFTMYLERVTLKVKQMQADLENKQKDMERRLAQRQDQGSSGQSGSQQKFRERQPLWVKDRDTIIKELKECISDSIGVTIVGICGSGKTELAYAIAEDETIKEHFPCICYPTPSPNFDYDCVTQHIHDKLADNKSNRVLILLDGLQKVDRKSWSSFRKFCKEELHSESKVLITTQNPEIAHATHSTKHFLHKLCEEECFTVIQNFAKSNGGLIKRDETAINIFKDKLFKKCMGLPLLAKHIGLLLSATEPGKVQNTIQEKILTDHVWRREEFESVLGNMTLVSLLQENPLLKWCLNYCSLFPPNTEFNKDLLVQLWKAEGLNTFQKEEEDFASLLSHSIFLSSDSNQAYEMHQLAYDFAQNVSSMAFCRKDMSGSNLSTIPKTIRHFSLSCQNITGNGQGTDIMELLKHVGKKCMGLRTFLLVKDAGRIISNPTFFKSLTRLRVLDVSYTNLTSLSGKTISELGYLRYLDLSRTPITEVPSLSKNPDLQVLKLNHCDKLRKLPKQLVELTNLMYLQVNHPQILTAMPPRMGQLKKLRGLELFLVGKREDRCGIEELKEMNDLRKSLKIAMLENVKYETEAPEAELREKCKLEKLELCWTVDSKPNEGHADPKTVLEGLVPPQTLTELIITNYSGSEFPEWLSKPDDCGGLNTLSLDNCKCCSNLPSLENLELLEHISLKGMKELTALPALPSSVKSLVIEKCSDALKQHCLDGGADWRKIKDIVVTIDSDPVPHQSSSIQIGDSPVVNDSDSREMHEDHRDIPSLMDPSGSGNQLDQGAGQEDINNSRQPGSSSTNTIPEMIYNINGDHSQDQGAGQEDINNSPQPGSTNTVHEMVYNINGDNSQDQASRHEHIHNSPQLGSTNTVIPEMVSNINGDNSQNMGTTNGGQPTLHLLQSTSTTIPLRNVNGLQDEVKTPLSSSHKSEEHPKPSKRKSFGVFRRYLIGCFSLEHGKPKASKAEIKHL